MAPPRRPKLPDSDLELWRRVTETVTPLKGRARPRPDDIAAAPLKPPRVIPKAMQAGQKPATAAAAIPPARPSAPPPLAAMDRKLTRRIGRGSRPVDAKVDLHGLTQREAHHRLLSFLQVAKARGYRLVLVVTGKGRDTAAGDWWEEGTRGVLRRAVPDWLSTPPFRTIVVGYEQAHLHKGGEGAIYVQLRGKDSARRPGGT